MQGQLWVKRKKLNNETAAGRLKNSINSIMTTVDVLVAFRAVIHFAFSEEKNGAGAGANR